MKKTIREKYNDLVDDIRTSYNKVKVIDNFDYYYDNPYTIYYLNKNESFDKFKDLFKSCIDSELCFDDMLWEFDKKARDKFDYIELGTLDIYTDSEYELEI